MISTAMRRVTAAAAVIIVACLIAAAAAVSAHGASQPQRRQISVTTLTHFKVVLTAARGGPGHGLQATVTAKGYRYSDGHWALIAAKRVGPVNGWEWFSVDTCSLTVTPVQGQRAAVPAVHTVRVDEGQPATRACARLLHYLQQALDAITSSPRCAADGA